MSRPLPNNHASTCRRRAGLPAVVAPGIALRTPPARAGAVLPFVEGLRDFDRAVERAGGRAPAVAVQAATKLRAELQMAKTEVEAYARRLKANGEVERFDALALARARATGSPGLVEGLRAAGGGYAALLRFDEEADATIAELAGLPTLGASDHVLRVLGIGDAHAGRLKRGACTAVMWVVTLSTSPDSAHRLCDRYS